MTRTSLFQTRIENLLTLLMIGGAVAAGPALAQDNAPVEETGDAILVSGRRLSQSSEAIGEDRVTNTVGITREALLSAPSGISGLKMLEQLPGFNVQTEGSLGLYEFGNSVQTRAFNLDQIGFTLDGIPMGRSDAFGGSPIFRYVDNENLGVVQGSPGSGDVSIPTYSSLGPVVQYRSIAPQDEIGLFVSQTFGEDALRRTFVRASSGLIGPVKGYVSYTNLKSDLWRGAGTIDREHWEAQLLADLGGDSWARLKFVSNDFFDYDSPTLSRAEYLSPIPDAGGKTGRNRGYIGFLPVYPPLATAPTVPFSNSAYTYYYGTAINIRKDKLFGATVHAGMTDSVWAESTLYWEDKGGYGVSPDSYANSLTNYNRQRAVGLPVTAPRGSQYGRSGVGGDRYGVTGKIHLDVGGHSVEAGLWAEVDKYHRTQLRLNLTGGSPEGDVLYNEIVYLRRDYRTKRDTLQFFLKDTLSLLDERLVVELGVKALKVDYQHRGYRDFNDYVRFVGGVALPGWGPRFNTASYSDAFLPMAGVLYRFDERTQLFGSYAENYALPKGMDDIYSVTFNSSAAVVPQPGPEKAQNFELGIRTNQGQFFGALAGYLTRFDNRIQSFSSILPGTGNVTETFFQNVGGVEAYGAEFTGSWKPTILNGAVYFTGTATYNHAQFQDNIPGVVALAGKYLPDSAKWIVGGSITVEPASWLIASVSGRYISQRYASFTNLRPDPANPTGPQISSAAPGYTVFNGYIDIGEGIAIGPVKGIRARLNVDNIFDKDTLSFISPSVSTDGFFRPLAPRTIQGTVSVEF